VYERNVRMARAGRFDWRLRAAVEYLEGQSFSSHEVAVTEQGVRIVGRTAYHEAEYQGIRQDAEIRIDCRAGSAERLARVLADKFSARIERW
jgi:hypothetical protein